jgi:hypothetical protein
LQRIAEGQAHFFRENPLQPVLTIVSIGRIMENPETLPDAQVDIACLNQGDMPPIHTTEFSVQDAKSANWVVRKIAEVRQYAAHVKEWAEHEQRRAVKEEASLLFLFGRQLEIWAKSEIEKNRRRKKSIFLPAGTVCFRHTKARLVIDDEAIVADWARQHLPDAIQQVEKLKKMVVNEHFESTGELPDSGTHIEPDREVFKIL